MMSFEHIQIRPLSGSLGAEVQGVDLTAASDAVWDEIRQAFRERMVLFFPDQRLDPQGLAKVGRQFGELIYYPFVEGLPEEPFVIPLIKEASETKIFGEGWHSDTTYTEQPPKATALYSIEVPDTGGDTMFANMYQAYETLSPGMKELLGPLQAVNSASARKGGGRATGNAYQSVKLINRDQELEGIHPVVRTHPETGREALYVNALHTTHFVGWREEESKPLLDFLHRHKARPEFTCRYIWRPATFAIWDNRAVQHTALNDYQGKRREMWRISIAGETPA